MIPLIARWNCAMNGAECSFLLSPSTRGVELLKLGCGFLKGCGVDLLGYLAELFVGSLFFRQRFVEQLGDFVLAQ